MHFLPLLLAALLLPAAIAAQAPPASGSLTDPAPPQKTTPAPPDTTTPREVGGDVLAPKLTHTVDPKYPRPHFGRPKESRVRVGLVITPEGLPSKLHIIHSGGAAFDKSALECVAQYRFSPATERGVPVPVVVQIDVNFQVFAHDPPPVSSTP